MALSPASPKTRTRTRRPAPPLLLASLTAAALLAAPALPGLSIAAFAQGHAQGTAPGSTQPAPEGQFARAAQASYDKARAAQSRGDLRTAQIEFRNAVRADPNSGLLRLALAQVSLDMGDGDTAEKEARAALERNYDPAAGTTALLLRTYLSRAQFANLLRDFPMPSAPTTPPALGAQIGAARVTAQLGSNDRAAARAEQAELLRLAPNAPETHLSAAGLAAVEGNRAEFAAAVERALAIDPDLPDALLRKAGMLIEQDQRPEALTVLDRLIARNPTMVPARILRAETLLRANELARAKEDVDAALRTSPNSVIAIYLRALLHTRAQEWRQADEALTRLGPALTNIPDGLLVLATVKRQLRQTEQAIDAVQRYVSRRPEDPRGAKLLAIIELETRQPAAAAGTLERMIQRGGTPDAETYDILARALMGAGRARDAAEAMQKVIAQTPNDAGAHTRLAAARLGSGDTAGTVEAAQAALRLSPQLAPARELLVVASLARGDIATAEAEIARLPAEARRSELAGVADATIRIAKLDVAGGRAGFEDVLKRFPNSVGARLGLARIAARSGGAGDAQRIWTEVLQRDPSNTEALSGLAVVSVSGGAGGASARAALEAAQAAAPSAPAPALTLANVLMRTGEPERALALLDSESVRGGAMQRTAAVHLMRAEANTLLQRFADAEAAARTAFADDPENSITRRQLALAMARNNDVRGAEEMVRVGLRRRPADPMLQLTLIGIVRDARGLDAALAVADELSRQRDALPAAAWLRGDLLLSAQRPAEAARSYAAAYATAPSAPLAQRAAVAWQQAGDRAQARAALENWLQRTPNDTASQGLLAQFELQDGQTEAAERRLARVIELAPTDAVALNNLAWALALRGGAENLARAKTLAERAYFLFPTPEAADTLGWVLVRSNEPQRGLPLLREAVAARRVGLVNRQAGQAGGQPDATAPDPGMSYRLAYALAETGDKAQALSVLEPVLADANARFDERADAERLLGTLRGGR